MGPLTGYKSKYACSRLKYATGLLLSESQADVTIELFGLCFSTLYGAATGGGLADLLMTIDFCRGLSSTFEGSICTFSLLAAIRDNESTSSLAACELGSVIVVDLGITESGRFNWSILGYGDNGGEIIAIESDSIDDDSPGVVCRETPVISTLLSVWLMLSDMYRSRA